MDLGSLLVSCDKPVWHFTNMDDEERELFNKDVSAAEK